MNSIASVALVLLTLTNQPLSIQGFLAPSHKGGMTPLVSRSSSIVHDKIMTQNTLSPRGRSKMPRHLQTSDNKKSSKSSGPPPAFLNVGLIAQNIANQALIGSTIWTGGIGYDTLTHNAQFGSALLLGVAGVFPMLAISRAIETSESPYVAGLNLSTNLAVLRMFGPNPQPIVAGLIAALISGLTGVVEEVTFRGLALPYLDQWAGGDAGGTMWTGAVLSTLLFAVLHTNPLGFFKSGEAFVDNAALLALQAVNGGILASLYLATGNLAVPIIAHGLYDFYTFYKTHLVDVAGQMSYAQREALMPLCQSRAVEQKWIRERGEDFVRGVKQTFYLMDTNRDGVLSRKELRIALFSYGITLSQRQSERVARDVDANDSGDIDFQEFLEYVGPTGSTGKAVRSTLLGPI